MNQKYIGAIDQGTTSTRFILFDGAGNIAGMAQKEHRQIFPEPGWVEHDPMEIWQNTCAVVREALERTGIGGEALAAVGVTNQRETVFGWNRETGKPYSRAVVWQCVRSADICRELIREGGQDRFREKTGLPVSTYFSGPKIRWLLDRIPEAREDAGKGKALFGTIESWLIWRLTGGPGKGAHVTDVTNAGRTLLMDIRKRCWDPEILGILDIPERILPRIVPSSDASGWGETETEGPFGARIPICGALGDQQAALMGQACFEPGEAKNTYGTGCFLLLNTGATPFHSREGLFTTPAFQIGKEPPVY